MENYLLFWLPKISDEHETLIRCKNDARVRVEVLNDRSTYIVYFIYICVSYKLNCQPVHRF